MRAPFLLINELMDTELYRLVFAFFTIKDPYF